jgi:methyl-accepting chemotaxis protein
VLRLSLAALYLASSFQAWAQFPQPNTPPTSGIEESNKELAAQMRQLTSAIQNMTIASGQTSHDIQNFIAAMNVLTGKFDTFETSQGQLTRVINETKNTFSDLTNNIPQIVTAANRMSDELHGVTGVAQEISGHVDDAVDIGTEFNRHFANVIVLGRDINSNIAETTSTSHIGKIGAVVFGCVVAGMTTMYLMKAAFFCFKKSRDQDLPSTTGFRDDVDHDVDHDADLGSSRRESRASASPRSAFTVVDAHLAPLPFGVQQPSAHVAIEMQGSGTTSHREVNKEQKH